MGEKIEPYKGISAIYDEIRPSYPERLIEDVIYKTNIKPGDRLLEIGPGTGKATVQFAEKGFLIHGVELGRDMAEIFEVKCACYPNVTLDVAAFEEWNCPKSQEYDMIYCAQAFHWLDPNVKYKKCFEILKDGGFLVLIWYNPCDVKTSLAIEMDRKIEDIIGKYVSNYDPDNTKPERRKHDGVSGDDVRRAEIEASGLFKLTEKIEYKQEVRNSASQYLKIRRSVPAFASILDGLDGKLIEKMDNEIEEVINNYGGYVSTLFNFSLYITKKAC
jgi:Dimethyladenosine transferase (rRNA methylation)